MRVLVVHCHPDSASLVSAARQRVLDGLGRTAHEVRVRDLYAEGFDPLLDADDHRRHLEPGPAPGLESYVDDLQWCEAIVFVYPTWWSGQPAMLKGWIDRVWVRGVAWDLRDRSDRLRPLLRNVRRLVVVTTHGSSKLVNAVEGESGKRTITRSLRSMCHPRCRTSWWAVYGIDTAPAAKRTDFLDRVEARAAAL